MQSGLACQIVNEQIKEEDGNFTKFTQIYKSFSPVLRKLRFFLDYTLRLSTRSSAKGYS